jgi:hypothetical protein
LADEFRALFKDSPGADRVVTDFGVAHIRVVRKTDRGTVSLELEVYRRFGKESIQVRGIRKIKGVALVTFGLASVEADSVENHQHELTGHSTEIGSSLKIEF